MNRTCLCHVLGFTLLLLPAWAWSATPSADDDLVFVHHSCGANWLSNGQLNATLTAKDYIDERNDIYYGTDMTPDGRIRWLRRPATRPT